MSRPSFDVLTEPWIPVVRLDGAADELGILPCLEQAHHIGEIKDPSPIVEFGIYRLLVAFVLDALVLAGRRPEDEHDLRDLLSQGSFDKALLSSYVEACGDAFDLFHPQKPFLQAVMEDENELKPLAGVFPAIPSGQNVSLWHHLPEQSWEVEPAEAVRLLTTISPFMTAGGPGLSPSINGAPAVYVLPLGRTLYEHLILNLPLRMDQEAGEGTAAWRSASPPGRERTEATTVEALTWRPRRIQLVPECDDADGDQTRVRVRRMKFTKGDSTRFTWIDANLAYRYENDRAVPIRLREGRSLWRDAGPLLFVDDTERGKGQNRVSSRRPDVVDQAFRLEIGGVPTSIHAYGMRTDLKMKVFEWAKAGWQVPTALGRSTRLGAVVFSEMDRAEQAARVLRREIRSLYPGAGARVKKKNALKSTSDRCERSFWLALEREFIPLLHAIATLDSSAVDHPDLIAGVAKDWRQAIRRIALEQFEAGGKDMDTDGDALERFARARARLQGNLRRVLS